MYKSCVLGFAQQTFILWSENILVESKKPKWYFIWHGKFSYYPYNLSQVVYKLLLPHTGEKLKVIL